MDTPDPPSQPPSPSVRASDADRERTATLLQQSFTDGRLNYEELQERLEQAYAARTIAELDRLREDLPDDRESRPATPAVGPDMRTHRGRRGGERTAYELLVSYVIFMLFLIGIWLATGRHGSFWPIWPMLVFGAIVASRIARILGR